MMMKVVFVCVVRSPGLTCGSLKLLMFSCSWWVSWPSFCPQLSSRERHHHHHTPACSPLFPWPFPGPYHTMWCPECNGTVLFHIHPLLAYCPTVWNQRLPPQHINTTLTPDSSFQTSISGVSSDNALRLLPSLPFHVLYCYTHACSAHLLLCACFHTHHLFLYASYYMPVSCLQ